MRWFPVLFYLGVAAWHVGASYDLFSSNDPTTRVALQECITQNHRSDAFGQAARAQCFEANLSRPTPPQQANFVDLWRAQGQGPMRGNDVRRQQ